MAQFVFGANNEVSVREMNAFRRQYTLGPNFFNSVADLSATVQDSLEER